MMKLKIILFTTLFLLLPVLAQAQVIHPGETYYGLLQTGVHILALEE